MGLNAKLRLEVKAAIEADPANAREVLSLALEGLDAWAARVRKSTDFLAYTGVSSALGLPVYRPGRAWLDVDNAQHRTMARMTAVGWNLHNRSAASKLECELVCFVRKADEADPTAVSHYRTLLGEDFTGVPAYELWAERKEST